MTGYQKCIGQTTICEVTGLKTRVVISHPRARYENLKSHRNKGRYRAATIRLTIETNESAVVRGRSHWNMISAVLKRLDLILYVLNVNVTRIGETNA